MGIVLSLMEGHTCVNVRHHITLMFDSTLVVNYAHYSHLETKQHNSANHVSRVTANMNSHYYYACFITVPDNLENGIQADATAYFGTVLTNAPIGTEIFRFRIVIDLTAYGAILTVLNRSFQVTSIFRFSGFEFTKTFAFYNGVIAANASGMLPPEISLLGDNFVVFEDSVIYNQRPPPSLELPATLDFDLTIIVLGSGDNPISNSVDFALGTVELIPPPPGICDHQFCYVANYY